MCTGHTHALAGLTAGVATAAPVMHLHHPVQVIPYLAACTGAGVLPDLDHPQATLAHCFGFLTKLFAWLVGKVSGGHRHGTHSIVGVAVFTGLAWLAVHYRYDWPGRIGLAVLLSLLFAGALYALRIGGHYADLLAIGGAVTMVWTGAGLATVAAATAVGCAAHLFMDGLTDEGIPVFWPVSQHYFHLLPEPFSFTTGTRPERYIVTPLLFIALAWLVLLALKTPLPHMVHAHLAARP